MPPTDSSARYTPPCHAHPDGRHHRIVAETRDVAIACLGQAQDLLPDGWTAHAHQSDPGGYWLLILQPPAALPSRHAYLIAPHSGHGWAIGLRDTHTGTDITLRAADSDRPAFFATLDDAVHAAVTALTAPPAEPPPLHTTGRQPGSGR